jgi:hypothetical protein
MTERRVLAASMVACILAIGAGDATAYNSIGADWRAQYPDACQTLLDATLNANDCILCHNAGSSALNPYGSDLASMGNNFLAVESFDSDGDGRNNGQEINLDCTFPGDVTSVPVESGSWSAVKALYR